MPTIKQSTKESVYIQKMDGSDPELIERRENQTLRWGSEPKFVKLYVADILYLQDMSKTYEKVTFALLKRCSYADDENPNCVILNSSVKKKICKEIGWKTIQSLDNALSDLVKGEILRRVDKGIYQFNPFLFGRGDWQDIAEIRVDIKYNAIEGRTFKTVLESEKGKTKEIKEENILEFEGEKSDENEAIKENV